MPLFSKRPILEFYKSFLMSPNFASYLKQRTNDVYRGWRSKYIHILCTSDLSKWVASHNDIIEIIDLLTRFREELARYSKFFSVDGDVVRYTYIKVSQEKVEKPEEKTLIEQEDFNHEDVGFDLGSQETETRRNPRHIKAKTAPLPSKSWSSLPDLNDNLTPSIQEYATVKPTTPFTTNPADFLEKLTKAKRAKSKLVPFGDFIPSVEQYGQLLSQSNLLISLLPRELRENF